MCLNPLWSGLLGRPIATPFGTVPTKSLNPLWSGLLGRLKQKKSAIKQTNRLNPLWSGLLGRHRFFEVTIARYVTSQSPLVGASGPASTIPGGRVVRRQVSIPSGRGFWAGERILRPLRQGHKVSIPSGRGFWAGQDRAGRTGADKSSQSPLVGASGPAPKRT